MDSDEATQATRSRPSGVINETFPYKVCINLDRRLERWHHVRRRFEEHGIQSVRRFPAFDGDRTKIPSNWVHTPGAYGCLLSHVAVVREARRLGVASVLIFEDDVVFDDHFEGKFNARIGQLPRDWDMLFFGALHKDEPIEVATDIARITQANSTYAYALKATVFDDFIELNSETEEVLDNNSLVLQRTCNCYCFMPHLAWVEAAHSDAQCRLVNHWYLRESLVVFGPKVDRLLSDTTIVFAYGDRLGVARPAESLKYLVRYYDKYFAPFVDMVIVEQGAESTVDRAGLPERCKYVFLRDDGLFDREGCFVAGVNESEPGRRHFILSDSDVYLDTLDIRGNLRMCEQYDCVTGFSKILDLTNEDSCRLRSTNSMQGIDVMKHASLNEERERCCRFLNREAIRILEGLGEGTARGSLLSLRPEQMRVFQSPNHALRLQLD